jgi:hypothetical protein
MSSYLEEYHDSIYKQSSRQNTRLLSYAEYENTRLLSYAEYEILVIVEFWRCSDMYFHNIIMLCFAGFVSWTCYRMVRE